ncbi:MAG: hypothetical protein H5U03_00645 [Clostridia bacterium]|nr:hypothetical protein [Clostridia bacterium]
MLTLITENQLDEWVRANARKAQGLIVELIWRLVVASCPQASECRFPLPDSIGQHGPDGILDTPVGFEPFVPAGRSYWEIGTGSRARDKATSDYDNLTEAVPESIRRNATFVFVTPLSGWSDWEYTWKPKAQGDWLKEHREKGEWKDVRIIDGTKLVDWLHRCPPVELWLAQKISNLPPKGIETPEQRWRRLSSVSKPPLTPAVFLANRDEAIAKLKEVFDGAASCLKLTTHYPNQVADFVSAYVASLDSESRIKAAGRCLIVSDISAWNTLCTSYEGRNFILIAGAGLDISGDIGVKLLQQASKAGHAVVFGAPHGGVPDSVTVPLHMPLRHQVQEELTKAGYSEERARTLVQKSGGNLTSLIRLLQGVSVEPEWAKWPEAADLAIALLIGAWSDKSEADRKAVEALVGSPYEQWIAKMRDVVLRSSTPLICREQQWKFVLRYEGWYALGSRLFDEHLERLRQVAISVLREKDPQFDLPKEERYAAQIYGKVLSHSHLLRNGLAESQSVYFRHSPVMPQLLIICSCCDNCRPS